MKRKVLLVALVVLCMALCIFFTACGDEEGNDMGVYGKSDKKIEVKPGSVTEVPQGYTKTELTEYSFIHPSSWGASATTSAIVNFETGEYFNVLKSSCDIGYVHETVTLENFDSAVAPLKRAFYSFSNVKDLGSGYFLADVKGSKEEKWTVRIEYSQEYNALYYLVSTATDAEAENTFFGSFAFKTAD